MNMISAALLAGSKETYKTSLVNRRESELAEATKRLAEAQEFIVGEKPSLREQNQILKAERAVAEAQEHLELARKI